MDLKDVFGAFVVTLMHFMAHLLALKRKSQIKIINVLILFLLGAFQM